MGAGQSSRRGAGEGAGQRVRMGQTARGGEGVEHGVGMEQSLGEERFCLGGEFIDSAAAYRSCLSDIRARPLQESSLPSVHSRTVETSRLMTRFSPSPVRPKGTIGSSRPYDVSHSSKSPFNI